MAAATMAAVGVAHPAAESEEASAGAQQRIEKLAEGDQCSLTQHRPIWQEFLRDSYLRLLMRDTGRRSPAECPGN
jgi:hypothetical protein